MARPQIFVGWMSPWRSKRHSEQCGFTHNHGVYGLPEPNNCSRQKQPSPPPTNTTASGASPPHRRARELLPSRSPFVSTPCCPWEQATGISISSKSTTGKRWGERKRRRRPRKSSSSSRRRRVRRRRVGARRKSILKAHQKAKPRHRWVRCVILEGGGGSWCSYWSWDVVCSVILGFLSILFAARSSIISCFSLVYKESPSFSITWDKKNLSKDWEQSNELLKNNL